MATQTRTITVELDPVEAHLVLGAITGNQIDQTLVAAEATGEASEWASIRAGVLGRVANRISDQFISDDDPRRVILAEELELGML